MFNSILFCEKNGYNQIKKLDIRLAVFIVHPPCKKNHGNHIF